MKSSQVHVEEVMGTMVSIDVRAPFVHDAAIGSVVRWLHEVDARFSTYRESSEIMQVARNEISIAQRSQDMRDVLDACSDLVRVTGGAFDPYCVAGPSGTLLDPSGYVKGWSVQRAAELLESHGATNFCINAGGDIAIRGVPARGALWQIGIRHPLQADQLAAVVGASGPLAIASSATYERGAHIIDPHTGAPAGAALAATVVGPDAGIADAFATAVFVMGIDGLDWIERQAGYEAYVITTDHTTAWSSGFPKAIEPRTPERATTAPSR